MSVSLSVYEHIRKHTSKLYQSFYACWCWLNPPLQKLQFMLCTSGFVDDVMFAHERPRGKGGACLLKVTHMTGGGV